MKSKTALLTVFTVCVMLLSSCGLIIANESSIPKKSDNTTVEILTDAPETNTESARVIAIDTTSADGLKNNAKTLLNDLQTVSAKGARIVVAALDGTFLTGDGSETVLTSDRVERIAEVEKKLDAEIDLRVYTEDELIQKFADAEETGEPFADVLAIPQRLLGYLADKDYVMSTRKVPKFDIGAGYFYKDAVKAMTAGHETYGVSGEGCFEPEKTYAVYFNKELAKEIGADPYALVSEGKWTLEEYARLSDKAVKLGKTAAFFSDELDINKTLLYGSGFDFTVNATDKTPVSATFTTEFSSVCALFSSLSGQVKSDSARYNFLSGKSLFYIDTVHAAAEISDSKLVWGLLPMPKADESKNYTSYLSDEAVVLCIPENAVDPELSGDFIEAISAVSSDYMKYDYIYYNLTEVLRDNGSVNSLKIILGGGNYDFVNMMRSGYPTLYQNTALAFEEIVSGKLTFEEYKEREADVSEYLSKWFPVNYR